MRMFNPIKLLTGGATPKVPKQVTTKSPRNNYGRYGASFERTALKGWATRIGSPYEDIERNIETLRERSRDLYMGAPIAAGALKTLRTNVIGSGLKLNAQVDADVLGMTQEEADEWETWTEREFSLWAESKNCDIQRMNDFYGLQQLAYLSYLMSGDVFTLLPLHARKGTPYKLCVQLLEADRVCSPNEVDSILDGKIVNGVEVDEKGEVVAYYIAQKHPKSTLSGQNKWQRVEKFGKKTGRQNVLHLLEIERPEQRRGVPILAPIIETLKQLSRYSDAELMAAVIDAMHTVYIESDRADADMIGNLDIEDEIDSDNDSTIEIGNGNVNFLEPGEKMVESKPARPNTAFDGFVTAMCRQIGVALELPYEVLMKHFTSSYSASRGALIEAWKMYRMRREWMARNFCQPIYEEFLTEAIALGRIEAPGYFDDYIIQKAYAKAEWNGPSQGQLDPLKEVQAAEKRVENGFSSRTKETIELTGSDFFEMNRLRASEEKVRRASGLDKDYAMTQVQEQPEEIEEQDDLENLESGKPFVKP